MLHVDPAHLVELALGNDVSSTDVSALRHIANCVRCRDELNRLARVVAAARSVKASDLPTAPPDRVWQRIKQELARSSGESDSPAAPTCRTSPRPMAADGHRTGCSERADDRTPHLLLGLLTAAAVIWWARRVPTRRSPPGHSLRAGRRHEA